jgi:hypothetical protein
MMKSHKKEQHKTTHPRVRQPKIEEQAPSKLETEAEASQPAAEGVAIQVGRNA